MRTVHLPPRAVAVLFALLAALFLSSQLAAPVHALQHIRASAPATPDDTPGTHSCPDCAAFAAVAFAAPLAALAPLAVAAAAVAPLQLAYSARPVAPPARARNRGPPSA
jgi:hypothetical protein